MTLLYQNVARRKLIACLTFWERFISLKAQNCHLDNPSLKFTLLCTAALHCCFALTQCERNQDLHRWLDLGGAGRTLIYEILFVPQERADGFKLHNQELLVFYCLIQCRIRIPNTGDVLKMAQFLFSHEISSITHGQRVEL